MECYPVGAETEDDEAETEDDEVETEDDEAEVDEEKPAVGKERPSDIAMFWHKWLWEHGLHPLSRLPPEIMEYLLKWLQEHSQNSDVPSNDIG